MMDMTPTTSGFTPPIPRDGKNSVVWALLDNWYLQSKYALAVTFFFVGFVGFGIFSQLWRSLRSRYPTLSTRKVYLLPTALARFLVFKRVFPRAWTAPRLGPLLPLGIFFLWTTIWTFSIRPYYRFQRNWGSPPLGTRAGWMAFGVVPWTLIFASRTSPMSLLTGVSAEKLQIYHQYGARILLFLSVVHTIPFIYQPLKDWGAVGLAYQWEVNYQLNWTGFVGLAALFWIVFSSFAKLRAYNYTFFVFQHILSAMLFMIMMFLHVIEMSQPTLRHAQAYIIASMVIFAFSYLARAALLLRSGRGDAEITILEGGVVRLDVETKMSWSAGQWVLVRIPSLRKFSSHPFTIASLPQPSSSTKSTSTLSLLARIQSPFGLVAELHRKNHRSGRIDIVLDGPYGGDWIGEKIGWKGYERVVLISGGSGASWTTARFLNLLRMASKSPLSSNFLVRQIDFVWVVRHPSHLTWFRPQLGAALSSATLPPSLVVNLKFFVSSPATMLSEVSSLDEEHQSISEDSEVLEKPKPSSSKLESESGGGSFETGRPDLSLMLSEIAKESMGLSLAVGVCGPLAMIDEVEDQLAELQVGILKGREGCREVMGKVERFGW